MFTTAACESSDQPRGTSDKGAVPPQMRLLKLPGGRKATAIAVSGETLVAAETSGLTIWDTRELARVAALPSIDPAELTKLVPKGTVELHSTAEVTCMIIVDGAIISGDAEGRVYRTPLHTMDPELLFQLPGRRLNDVTHTDQLLLFGTISRIASYDLRQRSLLAYIPTRTDVRSVSVDRTGAYLATAGANKTVAVYQIQHTDGNFLYKKVATATQPLAFVNDLCRVSWSPSGERFAVPNTVMEGAKAVGMVSRANWKPEFALVGQDATAVSCCPQFFSDGTKRYDLVAASGVDKSLTLWNTSCQRPLFTAAEVSTVPINDIAWADDGLSMFVAGDTIVVFVYDADELGTPVTAEALKEITAKLKIPEPLQLKAPGTPSTPQKAASLEGPSVEAPDTVQVEPVRSATPQPQPVIKDGKKRIVPTSLTAGQPSLLPSHLPPANGTTAHTSMEFDVPSFSVPKDLKRREETEAADPDQPTLKKKRELDAVEFIGNVAINPSTAFSKMRISTPKIRPSFILKSPNDETLSLEVKNGTGTEQKPTKVTLLKNGAKQIFADFIPRLVCLGTGGEGDFWAVATVDGVLYVYSDTGRRLFPPLVLGTPLSFLEGKGKYLLAVTSLGEVYAWDVELKRALFEPTSLYPLLSRSNTELLARSENLTMCSISTGGVPVVTIANGNGYLFDKEMEAWTLISDSWWAFGSQYWESRDAGSSGSLIMMLEKKTNDEIVRRGRAKFLQKMAKTMLMKEGYENLEKTISLAHLENRILIALKLGEKIEFKTHLIIYCKRISEMGFKARLLEIFQDLQGPQYPDQEWDPKILGYDKHELLKELIFSCASFRNVQRILVQFATSMKILEQVTL